MQNVDVMIQQLKDLQECYESREDDEPWWVSETGGTMVDYIDCPHLLMEDCLNDVRLNEYGSQEAHDACDECKAKWLMSEFNFW